MQSNQDEQKPKNLAFKYYPKVIFFVFRTIKREQPKMFALGSINTIINGISPVLTAILGGLIIGELAAIATGTASLSQLLFYVIAASLVQLGSSSISSIVNYTFFAKREMVENSLRAQLLEERSRLPLDQIELPEIKDRYEQAERGLNTIVWMFRSVSEGLSALISLFGATVAIMATLPLISILLIAIPVMTIPYRLKNYQLWRNRWSKSRASRVRAGAIENLFTSASSVLEIRLMNIVKQLLQLWRKETSEVIEVETTGERQSVKFNLIIQSVEIMIGVGIDIWLVFRVFAGAISVGLFEQTRRLVSSFISSVGQISSTIADMGTDAIEVNDYIDFVADSKTKHHENSPRTRSLSQPPALIRFENVSYTYPTSNQPAINGLDLKLKLNEHTAIVGVNGSGKSTLIKLMMGQYRPQNGQIFYDDIPAEKVRLSSLYKHTALLSQEFQNYDFLTVMESVAVSGPPPIDEERVKQSLETVGLLEFFNQKPKKLDTNFGYVEDDGIMLSGGQNQRLAIARMLYKPASILILDEPTSAIDAKSEQDIVDSIFKQYRHKSVIIVSHRLSTVSRADQILVMKDGDVVEQGDHEALFKPGTAYYDLFHKQAVALKK